MIKKLAVGTALLTAALTMVPAVGQAQERYYGNNYGGGYSYNVYPQESYGNDRYYDHEARERRERFERRREYREHLRRERERRYEQMRYGYGYADEYGKRRY